MRIILFLFFTITPSFLFSQGMKRESLGSRDKYSENPSQRKKANSPKTATLDLYRVITLEKDTTYIDTSLTIKKEYSHNYLRRDTFGLLPFPNDGQTYNTLQYNLTDLSPYPEFGFKAKHFSFIEANQMRYCSVATPLTELYAKTTQQKGQSVDSFFTMNTANNFNFSIAYRGLRSEGKYINQLSSIGNFRFTMSYNTKNKRYYSNSHYVQQDISNGENGGITNTDNFESGNADYSNRQRLEVYLTDAYSFLKGKRMFIDHNFRINKTKGKSNIYINHQFNYEDKYFEYNQATVLSTVNKNSVYRFGDSFKTSAIVDQTYYNKMYNKFGVTYDNVSLGKFQFFVDDFRSNYYYNRILIFETETVRNALARKINSIGGRYEYHKKKWNGDFVFTRSITNHSLSDLKANMRYDLDDENQFVFEYQNMSKLPNDNYNLHQSSYLDYNWANDFKNEKINRLSVDVLTPWLKTSFQVASLKDHLYFGDVSNEIEKAAQTQIIAPLQYSGTINIFSLKLSKEIPFGKWALDNTFLYQKVSQSESILNVPEVVTRNTIYFSDFFFKKALYLQAGLVLNYFTAYLANEYNPIIGEFFVQKEKTIGNYPNLDLFVNGKIQRTRIYFKAEHFNSSFTGNNFYSSPNNPYRDFIFRFGLVWNFFD